MRMKFLGRAGFTLIELMLVTTILSSLPLGAYKAIGKAKEISCKNNLKQIYYVLTMFTMSNDGNLPSACFYPKNSSDKNSLANILHSYLGSKGIFLCPSLPDKLKKNGITYIWNDRFSNQDPDSLRDRDKEWLMMEMTAVDEKIPPPHPGGYNILYLDGHIETKQKPPDLKKEAR